MNGKSRVIRLSRLGRQALLADALSSPSKYRYRKLGASVY